MSIVYSYTVVAVDAAARCMEIVYEAAGHPTQRISTRLPYVGESVEAIAETYAPVRYWEELKAEVVVPEVGHTGAYFPTLTPEEIAAQAAMAVVEQTASTAIQSAEAYIASQDNV